MPKLNKILIILFIFTLFINAESEQKFVTLIDFKLENSAVISECKIGYRTFGTMNSEESNIILFPTWFGGTSEHLDNLINGKIFLDSSKYFIIAVDALGNGVSYSPSNSGKKDEKYSDITITDMVNSQYLLLTEKLKINHIFSIVGGSMGGMQAFQWASSYPNFSDKMVAYVGTPRVSSYDLLIDNAELEIIRMGEKYNIPEAEYMKSVRMFQTAGAFTPSYRVSETNYDEVPKLLKKYNKYTPKNFTAKNYKCQLNAIMQHNIFREFDNSQKITAEIIKAEILMIVNRQDHLVNPQPAIEFAPFIDAEILILDNNRGHLGISYELEKVVDTIRRFLDK
ncbi:MAG: alpha/beta hydrolase [Candidatus Marinimicrobia bacterium]|nr:alpha/beta hydrolase [Candidatus Neomarinimicrobiota bacterium]